MTGTELRTIFQGNLLRFRTALGLSQTGLADRMSALNPEGKRYAAPYISDLERGKRSPTLETQAIIAEAIGVEPHELLR